MTDKELRKLSRLELLELLLVASKENQRLKEKIQKLKTETRTAQSIENLSVATRQIETALKYANSLTDALKSSSGEEVITSSIVTKYKEPQPESAMPSDKEIYLRMLCFFAKNDDKLSVFPDDIKNDVRNRIISILERGSAN